MIIDSSAIVAIIKGEAQAGQLLRSILLSKTRLISAASYVETAAVIDSKRDPVLSRRFDELLNAFGIAVTEVSAEQARIARAAYRDFGKGSDHPAGLNFGDCFSYALSQERNLPLLFVGDDFVHTDVRVAALAEAL